MARAYWPIGLCIVWVMTRNMGSLARRYAERRVQPDASAKVVANAPPDVWNAIDAWLGPWATARDTVANSLAQGRIMAVGLREGQAPAAIPDFEWNYLRISRRGAIDEVRARDGEIAYQDVCISAEAVQTLWPQNHTRALEAQDKASAKEAAENRCLDELAERMKRNPTEPIAKDILRARYADVSARAFDRLYSRAVEETGAKKWSLPGPRRRVAS